MGSLVHARVFLKDSTGRVIGRRPGVWSSKFDACQDCGTTERRHMARGFCHNCYVKWRTATNHNGYADKQAAYNKAKRLTPEGDARERAHDAARREARKADPALLLQRREVANRYNDKVSRWPLGSVVETPMGNLARWSPTGVAPRFPTKDGTIVLKGTIVSKRKTSALVRFATFEEWVPFARLTMVHRASRDAPREIARKVAA